MEPITTQADVIEDVLERDLSIANMRSFKSLDLNILRRLKNALREYSQAEYVRVPSVLADEPSFSPHPNSTWTAGLGGSGWGVGHIVTFPPEQLFGNLALLLCFFPRIAVVDGLEYHLDLVPEYSERFGDERFSRGISSLLQFYCIARPLIRAQRLVVIPRTLWLDAVALSPCKQRGYRLDDLTAKRILSEVKKSEIAKRLIFHELEDPDSAALVALDDFYARLCEMMQMNRSFGYSAILEEPEEQWLFHELLKNFAASTMVPSDATARAVVPALANVDAHLLIDAIESSEFGEFRQTLRGFDQQARSSRESTTLALKESFSLCLDEAKIKLTGRIQKSAVLRSLVSGTATLGLTVAANAFLIPQIIQDPIVKLMVLGVPTIIGTVIPELISHMKSRQSVQPVLGLVASLQERGLRNGI